jgi:acyl carrier protein
VNDPIKERVINIIAAHVGADPVTITPTATLEALGIASYQGIEMTFAIEDSFDINVPVGACDLKADTVGDMIDAVRVALRLALPAPSGTRILAHRPLPPRAYPSRCTAMRDEQDGWLYAENAEDIYT